jgi:DNA-binding CsgD family transcriptional regulator
MGDRKNAPRVLTHLTDRQDEVLRIVAKHGGNRAAAARELQVSGPSVFHVLKVARRRGIAIPESTRPRRAAV